MGNKKDSREHGEFNLAYTPSQRSEAYQGHLFRCRDKLQLDSKRVTKWTSARLPPSLGRAKGCVFFGVFLFSPLNYLTQRCGKRVKLIRDLVRDVAGTAPYEKRMMELLKTGRDKRALKLSKRKLGTHVRGKKKREEIGNLIRKMSAKRA